MVDAHKALAEAAYRVQPADDALVVALHPLGDGVALSVWRGRGGQLDRLWEQVDAASLHAHLARVDAALGLTRDARARLGALAARGTPDPALQAWLAEDLRADGRALSRARPRPVVGVDPLRVRLADAPREVAAASAWANLAETVTALVRRHVRAHRVGTVALAGEVFDDPRLVALVAEVPGVDAVHVLPRPGRDALALGAAVMLAGVAPRERSLRLGPLPDDDACALALSSAGLGSVRKATLASQLKDGRAVLRWRDRPGPGRHALGGRAVFVRADDAGAIARVRGVLGVRDAEEPLTIVVPTPNEGALPHAGALAGPLRRGAAAPRVDDAFRRRYAPVVAPDGRTWMLRAEPDAHPGLHSLIVALLRGSGCGAVAAFPVAEGDGPVAATPDDAVAVFRRSACAGLQLGSHWVERGRA
jgi:carbamoyltransferase